jgi:hypothetical protein
MEAFAALTVTDVVLGSLAVAQNACQKTESAAMANITARIRPSALDLETVQVHTLS